MPIHRNVAFSCNHTSYFFANRTVMAQSEQSPPPVCEAESHQLLSQKYTLLLMAGKRGRAFTGICVPQMHLNESDYIVDYPLALPSVFGDGGERIGDTIQETLDSFDTPRN